MSTLGEADMIRMQAEGWKFPSSGYVRVGNGWAVLAEDPRGDWRLEVIADPEQEPAKWPKPKPPEPGAQLEIEFV